MSYTFTTNVGDGVSLAFPFSFAGADLGYIAKSNISVFVAGALVSNYTVPSNDPNKVYFTTAPAIGAEVLIRRIMPKNVPYADFSRGNPFSQDTLNDTNLQQLYVVQELLDGFLPDGFYMKQDVNMGGHKLINLGFGTMNGDSINYQQYVDLLHRLEAIENDLTGIASKTVPFYYIATGGETRWSIAGRTFDSALVFINGVFQNQNLGAFSISNNGFNFPEPLQQGDEVYALIGSTPATGGMTPDQDVEVKQPFTGSVLENQHLLNSRSVGIFSFGVPNDGSATGGTDVTSKVQAALDWCASTGQTLDLQGADLFVTGQLNYQFKRHSIVGNNATFFVSEGSGKIWNLIGHTTAGNAVSKDAAYTFTGFSMFPGTVGVIRTSRTAISIGDVSLDCGGAKGDNIYISGFDVGMTFGNNSYIHNFTKFTFTRCNKGTYYPSGLSNSGENINFSNCVWANSTTCIDAGGDCVINVHDSSFDYTPEKIYAHAGGIVKVTESWFEGSDDDAVWVHTLNQLSAVLLDKCSFIVAGNRSKYLFDGATPQGGVILTDPMTTTTGNPVISVPTWGTGYVLVKGNPIYRRPDVSNDTIPYSASMNSIVSPNFGLTFTDSSRSDFSLRPASNKTTSRGETASTDAGVTYNPSVGYLEMKPPVGNIARITKSMLAVAGCSVVAGAYIKSSFSNPTDQLDLNLYFKNATGVTIAVYNKRFTAVNANSTLARANVVRGIAAPQGTAYIEFEITTTNPAVDGNSDHQISNFSIEASNGVINLPFDTTQSPSTGFIPYVYGATSEGSATYSVQRGGYTMIGNLVFINMEVSWSGHTGTGQLKVGNLPYLTDFPAGELLTVMPSGITTTGQLLGVMQTYSNSMIINQVSTTGAVSSLQVPASGTLHITGIYRRA